MSTDQTSPQSDQVEILPAVTNAREGVEATDRILEILDTHAELFADLATAVHTARLSKDMIVTRIVAEGVDVSDAHELVDGPSRWDEVYSRLCEVIGDPIGFDGLAGEELTEAEILRGGERNHPVGTVAKVNDPEGNPTTVITDFIIRRNDTQGWAYPVTDLADRDKHYLVSHEEMKAGLYPAPLDHLPRILVVGAGRGVAGGPSKPVADCTLPDLVAAAPAAATSVVVSALIDLMPGNDTTVAEVLVAAR